MTEPKEIPYAALSHGVRLTETIIIQGLLSEKSPGKIATDIQRELGTEFKEQDVKKEIEKLKEKGIIKKIAPIVDTLDVWNHLYFVLIKAGLTPPVVGVEMEYPTGWRRLSDMIMELLEKDELARSIVRHMYALQGTEWDLMLIVTVNDRDDMRRLCEAITARGYVDKIWSFEPIKGTRHYFDPIGIPPLSEIKEGIEEARSILEE
jgi:DNA-binding Lrp family transcriptional regulator